jgi:5'(3')-deoxyribonucleotidase
MLDVVFRLTGVRYKKEDLTKWDVLESIGRPDLSAAVHAMCGRPGYVESFEVLPGAQEGIERLSKLGTVVIVTSPMMTPNWAYERTRWLERHFGIPRNRIVHTVCKEFVAGDCLIDDKPDNLIKWHRRNPDGVPFMWDAPYNRNVDQPGLVKASTWDQIIDVLSQM